jgi:dihydrofolate synthase/folylpolyglutamate synthase
VATGAHADDARDGAVLSPREYLFSLERHGIKLGLENIAFLAEAAGNPERRYPSVHVAGTNGKGSVVALLDAMLHAAGYRTGRFTSPHLIDLNERFLLNHEPIDDAELDRQLDHFRAIALRMSHPPTFFELVTAVAFRWFHQAGVDLALFEVGLGGRYDSTNVINPVAAAITNIDREHTRYLGHSLAEIAFEKAGIIKPGVPVVVSETQPEPLAVIEARAAELNSPLRRLGRDYAYTLSGPPHAHRFAYESANFRIEPVPLSLPGAYQGENAATAVALAELLRAQFPRLTRTAIVEGLGAARWPCRLERVLDDPPVIIDVAHNAAGARKLSDELLQAVIVLAVSSDKNAEAMIAALAPVASSLILTQFTGPRALPLDDLVRAAGSTPHTRAESLREAIQLGLTLADPTHPLVITGSIFAAGEARQILIDHFHAPPLKF